MAAPLSRPSRAASRDEILAAAVDILHREGAGALTVRSVAAAAGCSTTGVYTWFGGKNGLVEAIFVDGFGRFGEALLADHARSADGRHLGNLGEHYRAWALANPTHYMVMFGKAVPDFEPSEQAREAARQTFDRLVESTHRVMDHFGIDGDAFEIAHHLWAGIHGYVSLELAGMDLYNNDDERAQSFRRGMRRLLKGVVPTPADG